MLPYPALSTNTVPDMKRDNETTGERISRHERHQDMLEKHRQIKALARERHRNHWHKFKPIPIILI